MFSTIYGHKGTTPPSIFPIVPAVEHDGGAWQYGLTFPGITVYLSQDEVEVLATVLAPHIRLKEATK